MNSPLQRQLLNRVVSSFVKKSEAVDRLSELLNLGKDAIYRRLRCDTLLSPDELSLLAKSFNISLDALVFGNSDSVFFTFNAFSQEIKSMEDYLLSVKKNLKVLGNIPESKIYYSASEIPIFYYCFFPELISFKLYVWGRTAWNLEYLQDQDFRMELISPQAVQLCQDIRRGYIQLSTTELWSFNFFDNTLNQIEFHVNSGAFRNEEHPQMLCDCLEQLADHMCNMAQHARKFNIKGDPTLGTPFELYHNEMVYTNNTIYLTSPSIRVVFSTYGNPNFLKCTDLRICDFTEDWFQKIIGKSNPISAQAEKMRNWFFKGLKRRIDYTRKRIEVQQASRF